MASEQSNEILMQMYDNTGNPLAAETQTELDTDYDPLIWDYTNGTCFTVDNFAFGLNIDDQDASGDAANTSGKTGVTKPTQAMPAGPQTKFGKWKSATPEEIKAMKPFPVRMDEFTVTRRFDRASPVLFQACARSTTFGAVSMVKRKTIGGSMLQTFLRIDFSKVLITHVSWDEAEVIKETLRFVFRELTIQYRRQAFDGTLNPAGSVNWKYSTGLRGK